MKTLAEMNDSETAEYIGLLGKATAAVIPPDGLFCLVVFDEKHKANYVSNCRRLEIPKALRELADSLERKMAETN